MRYVDLKEFGGRIVKGVNTTPDVGPNQIPIEAGKFGNKVDKDGRPPTLSKKVKGSKTNVLFNLGMAESVEERSLTKGEEKEKERIVKGMKKNKKDFKKRYGDDAEAVMYATATKMAKESKLNELKGKELSSDSEIYVDMDGVLVDFFGEWTKMMGVDNWKQIKNIDSALQKIRDTDDFWLKLKPTANADKLLSIIKDIKGEYNILSAPLANDDRAEPHKREWIKNNLTAFPPKKVIITTDKQAYAKQPDGTPNILIDDFGQNVSKWEASGGVGFKHKDHKFERTASSLKDYFKKPVEEGSLKVSTGGLRDMVITMIKDLHSKNDTAKLAKIARILGKEVYFSKDKVVIQDPDFDFYAKENVDKLIEIMGFTIARSPKRATIKKKKEKFDEPSIQDKLKARRAAAARGDKDAYTHKFNKKDESVTDEGELIPNPKNTVLSKSDTAYDFIKLGTHMANIKSVDPDDVNPDEPDVMIQFYGGDKEKAYMLKNLKRLGYDVQDADGYKDAHYDEMYSDDPNAYRLIIKLIPEKKTEGAEITMWTNPKYQGADVDDKYYEKQPVKIVDVSKLTPFEPADKMDPKDNHDNMMRFVDKIKAGDKIKPIVIVPHEGKLLVVDGHHRYFAHLKAGADKIRAVIADPKDLTWRDDVPESIEENFADGKKKGKSRPGRVKKAGASCKGSVSSLRAKARKYGGEKGKMYHWCANMKGGKKGK